MFESPIKIITDGMRTEIEGQVLRAVQNVGVIVDKEELLKALQYDREQYSKGYADGYEKAIVDFIERFETICDKPNYDRCIYFSDCSSCLREGMKKIYEELKGERE